MVTLEFHSTERSKLNVSLVTFANTFNEVYIRIGDFDKDAYNCAAICLDKETAIKLAKELRKQISFLEDEA